jgi:amidase
MVGDHGTNVTLDPGALRGRRIGVLREPYTGNSEHSDRVYESALVALNEAGAQLVDSVEIPAALELHRSGAERTILAHEFKVGVNAYLKARRGVAVASLQDVIDFNLEHADREMPYFRQEWLETAQTTAGLAGQEYVEARELARRLARDEGIDWALKTHDIEALVAPTEVPAFVIDRINGDRFRGYTSQLAAVAGYPHITVPAGRAFDALPVGLSFFTSPERETDLLAMAYAFEQTIQIRLTPQYLPTLTLP